MRKKSGAPQQQPSDATIFDTTGTTGLEQIMSSVAEMTLPEINRMIKTFLSQQLDTYMIESSKISFNSVTNISE